MQFMHAENLTCMACICYASMYSCIFYISTAERIRQQKKDNWFTTSYSNSQNSQNIKKIEVTTISKMCENMYIICITLWISCYSLEVLPVLFIALFRE